MVVYYLLERESKKTHWRNMGSSWDVEDLTEGGMASIQSFIGRLDEVEGDVEGKFGLQEEYRFSDVEIIEAGDDVTLDEGRLTSWVKESDKKNSTRGKMLVDWTEYAKAQSMGPLPSCFYGVLIRYNKETYEFGDDMNPGRAFVPVEIIESEPATTGKKTTGKKAATKPVEPETPPEPEASDEPTDSDDIDIPDVLRHIIMETIGDEGATHEMIRRAVSKKKTLRDASSAAGGLDEVLAGMTAIEEDDGTFTKKDTDDLPF